MKSVLFLFITLFTVGLKSVSFQTDQPKPWIVPEKNSKMVNPYKATSESISSGKSLYMKQCQNCHGKTGLGDGPKASEINSTPADLTKSAFQAQSDGSLFYKISEGRNDMPQAKKVFPDDEDRWDLVNFIRTFAIKK